MKALGLKTKKFCHFFKLVHYCQWFLKTPTSSSLVPSLNLYLKRLFKVNYNHISILSSWEFYFKFYSKAAYEKLWSSKAWTPQALVSSSVYQNADSCYECWFYRKSLFFLFSPCSTLDPYGLVHIDPWTFVCTYLNLHTIMILHVHGINCNIAIGGSWKHIFLKRFT